MSDSTMVDRYQEMNTEHMRTRKRFNWDWISHIVRDVFGHPDKPIIITDHAQSMYDFRKAEHSLGFYLLCGEYLQGRPHPHHVDKYINWDFNSTISVPGISQANFCLIFDYQPINDINELKIAALRIIDFMEKGSLICVVGRPDWAEVFQAFLSFRDDLTKEINGYTMIGNEGAWDYENL